MIDAEIEFSLDGAPARCRAGLTVAAALLEAGTRTLRISPRAAAPRSLFCGMGVCFDCAMEIDGRPSVRACATLVRPGMRVVTPRAAAEIGPAR